MPEIIENFYGDNLYTFTNYACSCKEDVVFEVPGVEPKRTFKMYSDAGKMIRFAYVAKNGLVRMNPNGTVAQENILGIFVGLANAKQKKIEQFLSDNGFLFPLTNGDYEAIDVDVFQQIINRMKVTVDLMSAINHKVIDYCSIVDLTLQLTLSEQAELKTNAMETPYVTCRHSFADILEKAEQMSLSSQRRIEENRGCSTFSVEDTTSNSTYDFDINTYNDIVGDYSNAPDHIKSIVRLFVNYNGTPTERTIIDLLFHFFFETDNPELFRNEKMQTAALSFAKFTLGEEINHNLTGIYPVYDFESMEPSWKVNSLISALYFSLFYLKPKMELYRPCGNPKCTNYFLVKTTSTKTKYCCTRCGNNVTQARYRNKRRNPQ